MITISSLPVNEPNFRQILFKIDNTVFLDCIMDLPRLSHLIQQLQRVEDELREVKDEADYVNELIKKIHLHRDIHKEHHINVCPYLITREEYLTLYNFFEQFMPGLNGPNKSSKFAYLYDVKLIVIDDEESMKDE